MLVGGLCNWIGLFDRWADLCMVSVCLCLSFVIPLSFFKSGYQLVFEIDNLVYDRSIFTHSYPSLEMMIIPQACCILLSVCIWCHMTHLMHGVSAVQEQRRKFWLFWLYHYNIFSSVSTFSLFINRINYRRYSGKLVALFYCLLNSPITYFINHHKLGIIRKLTPSEFILWKPLKKIGHCVTMETVLKFLLVGSFP